MCEVSPSECAVPRPIGPQSGNARTAPAVDISVLRCLD